VVNGVQDLGGISNNYATSTFRTAAVADIDAPAVESVTPGNGVEDVGLNTQVVVTFSESLNPATVNHNTFALFANGVRFGGIASVSADTRTVTLSGGTLPASSVVTLVITSGVQDLANNSLADYTSSFTTTPAPDTTRPSVIGQRPGNGASAVAATTPLVLFLNEPLDAPTVAGALRVSQDGVLVTGTVQTPGGGQVVQFEPTSPWNPNALIQVFLDASATDAYGNAVNPYQGSFRAAPDPQTTLPVVTATSPVNGISNVPLNAEIMLGYNVTLDAATVNETNVTFHGPSGQLAAAVSLDQTGRTIVIRPAQTLLANSFYSYQVSTAIRGLNGLAPSGGGYWYFYTGTATDTTAPSVRAVTPPDQATNVGDNAAIIVRFSEPVNPLTVNAMTLEIAGAAELATSMSFGNGNRDVFVVPQTPLPDNTVVTVTVDGVTDVSGNLAPVTTSQFTVAGGPDLTAPAVVAQNPTNGRTNVPTNVVVSLRTTEPIDPASVTTSTFQLFDNTVWQQAVGTYSLSTDGQTISFVPAAPLPSNRGHSVYFAWQGMTDLAGNVLTGNVLSNFSFTTGAGPSTSGPDVVATSPADQLTGVPRNPQIMIDFDRSIDTLTVSGITLTGGAPVALLKSFVNGDTRLVLTPVIPLAGSTLYTLNIQGVTDLSGLSMAAAETVQFTTGPGVDLRAPVVTQVSPSNGEQNVALNPTIQLSFSERMNPLTMTRSTLQLIDSQTGVAVAADVIASPDGLTVALVPTAPLLANTTYYVWGQGFADLSGQQTSIFTSFRTQP
jgi:hypothetical protein